MPSRTMVHVKDPAEEILEKVGDLSGFEVMHNDVLIGIYLRPEKTKSGIIITDKTRQEDEYQGKAGLVLKKGPLAFVSDENFDFKGQNVEVGDWISIWVMDGRKIMIRDVLCRMVEDRHIRLKIPAPDLVY
jgi:co-chaperonin GroES (HSP10)